MLADYIGAGGAFHSAVVVHYRRGAPLEWAFGGCDSGTGVFCTEPLALDGNPYVFKRTLEMGQSICEDDGVEALLAKMMDEWPGEGYDLTRRNCCHFAEAFCLALGVDEPFPAWVNRSRACARARPHARSHAHAHAHAHTCAHASHTQRESETPKPYQQIGGDLNPTLPKP